MQGLYDPSNQMVASSDPSGKGIWIKVPNGQDILIPAANLLSATGLLGLSYITDDRTSGGTAGAIILALRDAGKLLYHPAADTSSRVVTIPLAASVAFADTAIIPFYVEPGGGPLVFTPVNSSVKLVLNGAEVATATCAAGYDGVLTHITGERWKITGGSLS